MKEMSGCIGERVYEGNGGRSYIEEALDAGAEKLVAIVAKVDRSGAVTVLRTKECMKVGKVACVRKERKKWCGLERRWTARHRRSSLSNLV
jgi:hypothetical protein